MSDESRRDFSLFPSNWRVFRGGLGTRGEGRGEACHNRLDQHKAFGKLARRIREGSKADIPKQTEHSAERACRRNLFLPFQTERNHPPLAQFSGGCPVRPLYPLDFRYTLPRLPRLAICPPLQRLAQERENSLTFRQL